MNSGLFIAQLQLLNKRVVDFLGIPLREQQLSFVHVPETKKYAISFIAAYLSSNRILRDFIYTYDRIPSFTPKTAMFLPLFPYLQMYFIDFTELRIPCLFALCTFLTAKAILEQSMG